MIVHNAEKVCELARNLMEWSVKEILAKYEDLYLICWSSQEDFRYLGGIHHCAHEPDSGGRTQTRSIGVKRNLNLRLCQVCTFAR
jgi:hypothetical protein